VRKSTTAESAASRLWRAVATAAASWPASSALDPCYHQECDDIENVSEEALGVNADAIALSVLAYSYSTEAVNGVRGKPIPGGLKLPAPAGAEGTWAGGGGGLHADHGHHVAG
jgi:hypothetical protein